MERSIPALLGSRRTGIAATILVAVTALPTTILAAPRALSVASGASVTTLRAGILHAGEGPATFTTPHMRPYRTFSRRMVVPITQAGVSSTQSSCTVPNSVGQDGYIESLIEGFDSTAPTHALTVCSWRFRTMAGAHRAYGAIHADLSGNVQSGKFHSLSLTPIGDESVGLGTTPTSARIGAIVFRHANAVVALKVFTRALSASAFAHLGRLINQRLH